MTESDEYVGVFTGALREALARWDLDAGDLSVQQMALHYAMMLETNQTTNLTRITMPVEAAVKHYADSLALMLWARGADVEDLTLLDVGTGAGFPAVPLAIMNAPWRVTAIDGTRKKVEFVRRVSEKLGLERFEIVHGHSEHWELDHTFDVVCARAVGSLAKCMSFAGRLTSTGGVFIAYKTVDAYDHELTEAGPAALEHGLVAEAPFDYTLQLAGKTLKRRLAVMRRIGE
jgi:16S rRNA (guanine527-N7)-methyltransferase